MGLVQSLRAVVGQFGGAHYEYDDYDDAFPGPDEIKSGPQAPRGERSGGLAGGERRRGSAVRPLAIVRPPCTEFTLVMPQDFEDAEQIAGRLRAGSPVIVDLQNCGRDLSERLIDFFSGLTYALDGDLEYVGEKVVLLAPPNVELSSQDSGEIHRRRFLNQI